MDQGAATAGRVVLLCDGRWPDGPGVCCWRHSVQAAFGGLGAAVAAVGWPGPGSGDDLAAALAGADLVIAETAEAAEAAAAAGLSRRRLYALALPPEPHPLGARSSYAEQLARVAPAVGGFLTDGELARESLERALAGVRPRVEVFPPLAVDRACPACHPAGDAPAGAGGKPRPEVRQLRLWHELVARVRTGELRDVPYSFPAARLLGLAGPWAPARLTGWRPGGLDPPLPGLAEHPPPDWSAEAQQRAARRIWTAASPPAVPAARPPRAALLAGFNLKFAVELTERLNDRPDLDLVVDEWPTESEPTELTGKLLDSAESIFAEWIKPSTVWLSRHKRPDQFLAARLHRYELESPHPRELAIENVDAVVYIAPMFGRRIRDELGWPAEKLVYIPNFLEVEWFDRPKLPEARFGLGLVGVESMRKRFDLALDLLAEVRRADPRFTLFVRSVLPWDNRVFWKHREEREFAGWCLERLRRDPLLRGGVVFDPPGRDMARWYRQVGHILSTSDSEGSHMAPAEGMAAGSVPVIRPWPGAVELYDLEWVHTSTDQALAAILANADPDRWSAQAARAQAEIRRSHDPAAVLAAWADLLHGDVAGARSHFAEYSGL
jgi:glycosyltransferase involved in cell wall biosynthesis